MWVEVQPCLGPAVTQLYFPSEKVYGLGLSYSKREIWDRQTGGGGEGGGGKAEEAGSL